VVLLLLSACYVSIAVTKEAKYKGDIFMVFDYAEHDLTGMMEAVKNRPPLPSGLKPEQARLLLTRATYMTAATRHQLSTLLT
jgi:hypothetical protein